MILEGSLPILRKYKYRGNMEQIDWADFLKVELSLRVWAYYSGRSVWSKHVSPLIFYMSTLVMKLALRNRVRRLLERYQPELLLGKLVVAVVNFPNCKTNGPYPV